MLQPPSRKNRWCTYLTLAGLDISDPESDVGPGRTALAAVASEPAAMDADFPAPARSRFVDDVHATMHAFFCKRSVHPLQTGHFCTSTH